MKKQTRQEPDERLFLQFEVDYFVFGVWKMVASFNSREEAERMAERYEGYRIRDIKTGEIVYEC